MSTIDFDPFAGGEILRVSPTTGPQQEIIASVQMSDQANTAFNESVSLSIEGTLDVELMENCFHTLVDRHDILSATFSRRGDEICLSDRKNFSWQFEDLGSLSDQAQKQEIEDLCNNIAISPMNLEEGPLFHVWLLKLAESQYQLLIAVHHVICDGWSFGIMLNELVSLYNDNGETNTLPIAPSFFDFAEENEAIQIANADIDHWLDKFKQSPPSTLDLPLDKIRPASRTFEASRYDYQLNPDLVSVLPKAAAAMKASLVNLVMGGYFALLHRLTGNEDIIVGLPVAGQSALGRPDQMGHMVQLLPIRIQFDEGMLFKDLVNQVKGEVLTASEHANFTFGKILESLVVDRSRVPLISTIFNIDQKMPDLNFGAAIAKVQSVPRAAENFEIFLNVVPTSDSLTIEATYSTALFSEATIQSWLQALECLLRKVVESPESLIKNLPLTDTITDVALEANKTETSIEHADLITAFRAQVLRVPDSNAVKSGDIALTYADLDRQSNCIAQELLQQGIAAETVVGICCQRSEKMLASALAILKIGAVYLPLDPEFPAARLTYMLEDSGAMAVLEDDSAPAAIKDCAVVHINLESIELDSPGRHAIATLPDSPIRRSYVIYTSGSTGKPKGVCVQNEAMINFLEGISTRIGFTPEDRLLAVTTLSFDISVLELFMPLVVGGTVIIANNEEVKDGEKLSELINRHGVSIMQATPATWRILLASSWTDSVQASSQRLKALCGGEALPPDLAAGLFPLVSELWNMYGPTETTVWSSCKRILHPGESITIGLPIANTQIYILTEDLKPLPLCAPGELCIGGKGVTLGYHERPDLTADRFVEHPQFGRIYRTGDYAMLLPNGEVQHLGRLDDQVKLRGFRIELGEIETCLANCAEIEAAGAYLWELNPDDVRLVACCVSARGENLDTIKVRKQLREQLPQYMMPQYYLSIEKIPLTVNGKVDRRALPRPEITESSILSQASLVDDTEKLIAKIWTDLIHPKSSIGRDDNFFEIGGHSLLALEAVRKIESATGIRLKLADIIASRLSTLAEQVNASAETDKISEQGPVALPRDELRRLSEEQERILKRQLSIPDSICNNLPAAWILTGNLDLNAFEKSLRRVWERQTALRTVISESDGMYRQFVRRMDEISPLDCHDLTDQKDALKVALKHANDHASEPFMPLDHDLYRVALYKITDTQHLFCFTPHQLIFDGWSFDVVLGELEKNYAAFSEGKAPSTSLLPFEFRDFADWSAKRLVNKENAQYHSNHLAGAVTSPILDIGSAKGEASRQEIRFGVEQLERVENFCSEHNVRIHELFFAAYAQAICAINDSRDAVIGIPVTGRYTPEVIGLVGSFISVLPCKIRLGGSDVLSLVLGIAAQLKEFHDHQDITFARVVDGTAWQHQSFPTCMESCFGFQDVRNRPTKLSKLALSQIDMLKGQTEFPVEFWVRVQTDNFLMVFDFDSAQVSEALVKELGTTVSQFIDKLDIKAEPASALEEDDAVVPSGAKTTIWRRLFQ